MDLNYGKNLTRIISILSVFYWLWWQLVRAEHVTHTHDFNMDDIFHGDMPAIHEIHTDPLLHHGDDHHGYHHGDYRQSQHGVDPHAPYHHQLI